MNHPKRGERLIFPIRESPGLSLLAFLPVTITSPLRDTESDVRSYSVKFDKMVSNVVSSGLERD